MRGPLGTASSILTVTVLTATARLLSSFSYMHFSVSYKHADTRGLSGKVPAVTASASRRSWPGTFQTALADSSRRRRRETAQKAIDRFGALSPLTVLSPPSRGSVSLHVSCFLHLDRISVLRLQHLTPEGSLEVSSHVTGATEAFLAGDFLDSLCVLLCRSSLGAFAPGAVTLPSAVGHRAQRTWGLRPVSAPAPAHVTLEAISQDPVPRRGRAPSALGSPARFHCTSMLEIHPAGWRSRG